MHGKLVGTEGEYAILRCPDFGNTKDIGVLKTLPTKQWFFSSETVGKLCITQTPKPDPKWMFIIKCSKCGFMRLVPDSSDRGADFKSYEDYSKFMAKAEKYLGRVN